MSSPPMFPGGVRQLALLKPPPPCRLGNARFARMWQTRDAVLAAGRGFLLRLAKEGLEPTDWLPLGRGDAICTSTAPDGSLVYVGRYPHTLEVRDAGDLAPLAVIEEPAESEINSVAPSPDGALLVTTTREAITLRDPRGIALARVPRATYSVAWSPDGQWLAAGGRGDVVLFDRELIPLDRLVGHEAEVSAIRFIPGTQTFVTVAKDGTCCKWRRPRRSPIFRVRAHDAAILAVAASPDVLVTKGRDERVRFLGIDDGRLIAEYHDPATWSGWCVGIELDQESHRLFVPSRGEELLRVLELDLPRLLRGRVSFLFDLAGGPARPRPRRRTAVKRQALVPLFIEDDAERRIGAREPEDDVVAALFDQVARAGALAQICHRAPPIACARTVQGLLALVSYGDEPTAAAAGSVLRRCTTAEERRSIGDDVTARLRDDARVDVEVWRDLRMLRRLSWLMTAAHRSAVVTRLPTASPALRSALLDTLRVASERDLVSVELLVHLMEVCPEGRGHVTVALRRHPEGHSPRLRASLDAWHSSDDAGLARAADSLVRWFRERPRVRGTSDGDALPEEDVLDPSFLETLVHRPLAQVPDQLAGRVMRLLWLPPMTRSDVPLMARRLVVEWIEKGARLRLGFEHEPAGRRRATRDDASLVATRELRRTFSRLAGLDEVTWREGVRRRLQQAHGRGDLLRARHWARLLADHERLDCGIAPLADAALATVDIDAGSPRYAALLRRSFAGNATLASHRERTLHLELLIRLWRRAGRDDEAAVVAEANANTEHAAVGATVSPG